MINDKDIERLLQLLDQKKIKIGERVVLSRYDDGQIKDSVEKLSNGSCMHFIDLPVEKPNAKDDSCRTKSESVA